MTASDSEKFATQVNSELLAEIRAIAKSEGRELHALVEEALADLVEKRRQMRVPSPVMTAYQGSHEKFSTLYKKLAE